MEKNEKAFKFRSVFNWVKKHEKKFVKACPKCGNTNLASIDTLPISNGQKILLFFQKGLMTTPSYLTDINPNLCKCRNCGYRGNVMEAEKKDKRKFIKTCPKCGSTNIGLPGMKSLIYRKGTITQPILESGAERCRDCNYHGIMVEIDSKNLKNFRKAIKNRTK